MNKFQYLRIELWLSIQQWVKLLFIRFSFLSSVVLYCVVLYCVVLFLFHIINWLMNCHKFFVPNVMSNEKMWFNITYNYRWCETVSFTCKHMITWWYCVCIWILATNISFTMTKAMVYYHESFICHFYFWIPWLFK